MEGRYANSKEMYKSAVINYCFKTFYYIQNFFYEIPSQLLVFLVGLLGSRSEELMIHDPNAHGTSGIQ